MTGTFQDTDSDVFERPRHQSMIDEVRLMTGTFQDTDSDVFGGASFGLGQGFDTLCWCHVQCHRIRGKSWSNGQFFHIGIRRVQHGSAWAHGNHGQCVWHVFRRERCALKRIKRDINARSRPCADFFANKEHGRFVTLAFADDNDTCDVQFIQLLAHRVHGRLIGCFFITATNQIG